MKWKLVCATAIIAVLALPLYSLEPTIESILYNPAVAKKQLSPHVTQATGYRTAGEAQFIVHFRKEALHGSWETFYNKDQRCDSGMFDRNLPTGEWKTWYRNGHIKSVRYYSAEKYHYIKADVRRGHPKDQRYVITKYAATGAGRYFQPLYETAALATNALPMLQKIQHNTTSDGRSYSPPFSSCLHHGLFINYTETGAVRDSGVYENGVRHGLWKEAGDGLQAMGFYNHGTREGQWKYYDVAGRLTYTEHFNRNGKRSSLYYFRK